MCADMLYRKLSYWWCVGLAGGQLQHTTAACGMECASFPAWCMSQRTRAGVAVELQLRDAVSQHAVKWAAADLAVCRRDSIVVGGHPLHTKGCCCLF
jgi:hypothetical protein